MLADSLIRSLALHLALLAVATAFFQPRLREMSGSQKAMGASFSHWVEVTAAKVAGVAQVRSSSPENVGKPLPGLQASSNGPARAARNASAPEQPEGNAPGIGSSDSSALSEYFQWIHESVRRNLVYPLSLQRRGVAGQSTIRLLISPEGELQEAALEETSGNAQLDRLALEAARMAAPFPSPPSLAAGDPGSMKLLIPVVFRLQ